MITEAILYGIMSAISIPLGLLDNVEMPDFFDSINYYAQTWNFILPIADIFIIITAIIVIEGSVLTLWTTFKVINLIRGSG